MAVMDGWWDSFFMMHLEENDDSLEIINPMLSCKRRLIENLQGYGKWQRALLKNIY